MKQGLLTRKIAFYLITVNSCALEYSFGIFNAMSDVLTKTVASIKAAKIIPDVINDEGFVPSVLFSVVWSSTGTVVILGEEIQLERTVPEPDIRILPMGFPKSDASYTLVMTDPDAPMRSNPVNAQWKHWVVSQ